MLKTGLHYCTCRPPDHGPFFPGQTAVVPDHIKVEQGLKPVRPLYGAPGAAGQGFKVVPHHGAGVVQGKQRVKSPRFQLTLTDDTTPPPLVGAVYGHGEFPGVSVAGI